MKIRNKIKITIEYWKHFKKCDTYHICEKQITWEGKVKDHDPLTDKYRGTGHNTCN